MVKSVFEKHTYSAGGHNFASCFIKREVVTDIVLDAAPSQEIAV
jgi:hypothetical protein